MYKIYLFNWWHLIKFSSVLNWGKIVMYILLAIRVEWVTINSDTMMISIKVLFSIEKSFSRASCGSFAKWLATLSRLMSEPMLCFAEIFVCSGQFVLGCFTDIIVRLDGCVISFPLSWFSVDALIFFWFKRNFSPIFLF